MSALSRGKIDYHQYINSEEWRSKHPGFLAAANYQCSAFPWCKVGKGAHYRCHHVSYANLGNEKYWWDVLCLSPFAHKHIVHGILSGYKRPSEQDYYPNRSQSLFHSYCRLPVPAKYAVMVFLFALAGYLGAGELGMAAGMLIVVLVLR
ncbi:general secretion pathway protein GspF [Phormidium sp. FACHB-592]|uniref:Uncharacterized protein n=1 Tax=Stenomitos frigidus AS-A4 TaxID=2933935 RepID=A0ABV0KEM8_9CYAN|nr:general secretion pathway protein GspF [Phormidium sp. FACHB-592]MBD2076297.1 general secretion pathway protein GspF [Phormidium sp. FACHB-592]